jgi:hypothetical protein
LSEVKRRTFMQISTAALLTSATHKLSENLGAVSIFSSAGTLRANGQNYSWEYSLSDDTFLLLDSKKRLIISGKVQPSVIVSPSEEPSDRQCSRGKLTRHRIDEDRITLDYDGVNGSARLSITWRFDDKGLWIEPIVYESSMAQDIVSLHYFADFSGMEGKSTLHSTYLIVPGISEGSSLSPILRDVVHLDEDIWLGRGSVIPGLLQQWGLPLHYFCGFSVDQTNGFRNMFTAGRSDAFVCGLADLPNGDLFLNLHEGRSSLWIDYRSDLWKHLRTPGRANLGSTLFWTFGPDYYDAIGKYYQGLVQAGIIRRHKNSERKTAIALTPQIGTWGAQVNRNRARDHFDEAFLTEFYDQLKASGMKAGMFSIDDKWEGSYGNLQHSAARLPHFERFLDKAREEGYRIGLWAAFMRCERPSDIGLSDDHMLKKADGKPFMAGDSTRYYILDFTQAAVERTLSDLARRFIRRYKPDLVKFDFGYELPSVSVAAPQDKNWMGERMMWKGLDVVIKAMREENSDLVVMYYSLSPLFLDYFDLHSSDDLFLASGEYDLEANRRFYFSSLLGPLGIPTYGSSGYDWVSAPNIWFDSAPVGTIGSMNDFQSDEEGEGATPEAVARYNGITQALRSTNTYEVLPLDTVSHAPTLGAHARSWARFEGGKLVLIAFRPPEPGGENRLASRGIDPRVRDLVHSNVPVLIASKTDESITQSSKLAIVPYGSGRIEIVRQRGRQVTIVNHYMGETVTQERTLVESGRLNVAAESHNSLGKPLEWIEVTIS